MPSPMLSETTFERPASPLAPTMSASGTARAQFVLVGLLVIAGAFGWALNGPVPEIDPQPAGFSIVALIVAFAVAIWAGFRPATPQGTPILGASPSDNLFLNVGHGALGWTLALASGRVVADTLAGRVPAIDLEGFRLG